MAIVGATMFSQFFVLTLYLQDVLHYTAMQSGLAFVAFAGTVVVVSNLAQRVIARVGVRAALLTGLTLGTVSLAWLIRLPAGGSYPVDLFPAFVLGGAGMGLSFVAISIVSLAGVGRRRRHRVGPLQHLASIGGGSASLR